MIGIEYKVIYKDSLHKIAASFRHKYDLLPILDFFEYLSICNEAVVHAENSYIAGKYGMSPKTWGLNAAFRRCQSAVREESKRLSREKCFKKGNRHTNRRYPSAFEYKEPEDPLEVVIAEERCNVFNSLYKYLNREEEAIFWLYFYQNKNQKQIAPIMGWSRSTCSRRIKKLITKLKKLWRVHYGS